MMDMQSPTTFKELETCLGTFGYYRMFIPNFSQVAAPLLEAKRQMTNSLRLYYKKQPKPESSDKPIVHYDEIKNQRFKWTPSCQEAFDNLKRILSSPAVLMAPRWDAPFVLYCDASYHGYGVALHQLPEGMTGRKNERPLLYMSRSLDRHESNYAPTEIEGGCVVWALSKLAHYLDGSEMQVVTDHRALQWLLKVKDLPSSRQNNRLLRWSILLLQFADKMTVIHRPGVLHGNVDGLSRLIAKVGENDPAPQAFSVLLTDTSEEDNSWAAAYHSDRTLRIIYEKIENNWNSDDSSHAYHLYSVDPDSKRMYVNLDGRHKLCVPEAKLDDWITSSHVKHAHLGLTKTYERLSRSIWHPKLHKRVSEVLSACASCRENGIVRHKPYGVAQPVLSPSFPFDTVACDFVTGLPESEGFDAFMSVTDKFTKTIRIIPCRTDDDAPTMARRFFNVIYRYHGLPRRIVSDRDSKFTSMFWKSLTELTGIARNLSTSWHPQSDGQSEKTNQVVEIALRHVIDYTQAEWTRHLPTVEFAVNMSINESTKVSPYEMLYGVKVRDCIEAMSGSLDTHNPTASEFNDERIRIRQRGEAAIAWAQARQAKYYDDKHKPKEYAVGDSVMLSTKDFKIPGARGNKLGPRRIGPFKVLARHGKLAYELDLPDNYRMHRVISIAKLEDARPSKSDQPPPPMVTEIDNQETYEVECILAQGRLNNQLKYKVKWKGYAESEATWEPAVSLRRTAPDVVKQWIRDLQASSS